jgi:hypothetical protein
MNPLVKWGLLGGVYLERSMRNRSDNMKNNQMRMKPILFILDKYTHNVYI